MPNCAITSKIINDTDIIWRLSQYVNGDYDKGSNNQYKIIVGVMSLLPMSQSIQLVWQEDFTNIICDVTVITLDENSHTSIFHGESV